MYNSRYSLGGRVRSVQTNQGGSTQKGDTISFGRVETVVLDESVELYDNEGIKVPIGGIRYKLVTEASDSNENYYTALPLFGNIQLYPFENEVVAILNAPDPDTQVSNGRKINYYLNSGVINVWGTPHHNALPGAGVDFKYPIGKDVIQLADINPLYPFPGDTLIEGRHGQSIRLGGTKSKMNKLVDAANDGKPYLLISNGQLVTDTGLNHITEDIDKDPNSLYFLSDHTVNLTPANNKRASYDLPPTYAKAYRGNQVVVNGGRLFFNAKEESILLSAKESVGLNATTLNLDATDYICLDGKTIFLGAGARTASVVRQPVILGTQFENWMNTLLDTLQHVAAAMTNASAVSGGPVTQLNMVGPELDAVVASLKTQIVQFKSKKVFTE